MTLDAENTEKSSNSPDVSHGGNRPTSAEVRFRDALRKARMDRGLSHTHLADMIGSSDEHMRQIERGTRDPNWSLVAKLALILDIDLTKVLLGQKAAAAKRKAA